MRRLLFLDIKLMFLLAKEDRKSFLEKRKKQDEAEKQRKNKMAKKK